MKNISNVHLKARINTCKKKRRSEKHQLFFHWNAVCSGLESFVLRAFACSSLSYTPAEFSALPLWNGQNSFAINKHARCLTECVRKRGKVKDAARVQRQSFPTTIAQCWQMTAYTVRQHSSQGRHIHIILKFFLTSLSHSIVNTLFCCCCRFCCVMIKWIIICGIGWKRIKLRWSIGFCDRSQKNGTFFKNTSLSFYNNLCPTLHKNAAHQEKSLAICFLGSSQAIFSLVFCCCETTLEYENTGYFHPANLSSFRHLHCPESIQQS